MLNQSDNNVIGHHPFARALRVAGAAGVVGSDWRWKGVDIKSRVHSHEGDHTSNAGLLEKGIMRKLC